MTKNLSEERILRIAQNVVSRALSDLNLDTVAQTLRESSDPHSAAIDILYEDILAHRDA